MKEARNSQIDNAEGTIDEPSRIIINFKIRNKSVFYDD